MGKDRSIEDRADKAGVNKIESRKTEPIKNGRNNGEADPDHRHT
jgi:hypothetical protein